MNRFRRFLSVLLLTVMLIGIFPAAAYAEGTDGTPQDNRDISQADYDAADLIFEKIFELDAAAVRSPASKAKVIYEMLSNLEGVAEGSPRYSGADRVTWMTSEGIACVYSPRLQEIAANAQPVQTDLPDRVTTNCPPKKTGHSADVYLVQPYYGIDSNFTTQYQEEAARVAETTGGSYHYAKNSEADIDFIAEAIQNGGVIFFDSHGDTDYANGNDYTSGARTSYLCLQSGEGITADDYAYDSSLGTYHAVYGGYGISDGKKMYYYEVDGTAIANHMTSGAAHGLLWSAICLGMATNGLHAPLRARGLDVAYGYSQSVTFGGDYCYEEEFFDRLLGGATVSESIGAMKARYGNWDCSPQICSACNWSSSWAYNTEEAACADYAAFPIVVSAQDPYPGHGNVDKVQQVYSTWKLTADEEPCDHQYAAANAREATCEEDGYTGDVVCTLCGDVRSTGTVIPAAGHTPVTDHAVAPTVTETGMTEGEHCSVCGEILVAQQVIPMLEKAAPTVTTAKNYGSGILVEWDAVEGATGYVVYRRAMKAGTTEWTTFARWNNTKELKFLDTKAYEGTKYQYGIKAYYGDDPTTTTKLGPVGPMSKALVYAKKPAAPASINAVKTADGVKLTWSEVKGATGYVVYRRAMTKNSTTWTAFARWNNTTELTFTDTKLYAGTKYQYGVKAYFGPNPADMTYVGPVSPMSAIITK